jgi:GxxExxY protein
MPQLTQIIYKEEVYNITGACMEVHNQLGHGFLEAVYQEALEIEFAEKAINYEREVPFQIAYKGNVLKHSYIADFLVFDSIILELKSTTEIHPSHIAQTINYLRSSGKKLGLIVNFGKEKLEYKRIVL